MMFKKNYSKCFWGHYGKMESGYKREAHVLFCRCNCGLVNCLRHEQIICLSLQVKVKTCPNWYLTPKMHFYKIRCIQDQMLFIESTPSSPLSFINLCKIHKGCSKVIANSFVSKHHGNHLFCLYLFFKYQKIVVMLVMLGIVGCKNRWISPFLCVKIFIVVKFKEFLLTKSKF